MKKAKKQTTFREDAGKALLDLGKLVFGGIFIAAFCVENSHTIY
jgi:hypothetical protein